MNSTTFFRTVWPLQNDFNFGKWTDLGIGDWKLRVSYPTDALLAGPTPEFKFRSVDTRSIRVLAMRPVTGPHPPSCSQIIYADPSEFKTAKECREAIRQRIADAIEWATLVIERWPE